jgi:hypothetical protein
MKVSNLLAGLLLAVSIGIAFTCISCAAGKAAGKHSLYYENESIDNNQEYFNTVTKHFTEIGNPKSPEEIKNFVAAIFIASLPPVVEVYEGNDYTGKTNVGLLYFKPGTHKLQFRSSKGNWEEEITLKSGRNGSIMAKK